MAWHLVLLTPLAALLSPSDAIAASSAHQRRGQAEELVILPTGPALRSEKSESEGDFQEALRLEHKANVTAGRDFRCSPAGISPENMGVAGAMFADAKKYGYCYYLGRAMESCTEVCERQMGGTCNAAGTESAARTTGRCQRILEAFSSGQDGIGHTENVGTSRNDRSGCSWIEMGPERPGASRVEVFEKGEHPLCSAVPTGLRSHRVCACTAFFGNFSMYDSSDGNCHARDGGEVFMHKSIHETPLECEDECTRDSTCGAFSFVDGWDSHSRQCHFFTKKEYVGDGVNKLIKCHYKKDLYLNTLGRCKKHFGKFDEKLSDSKVDSVAECKAACDAHEGCEAFGLPYPMEPGSECELYNSGHTGNAVDADSRCYTRATGGVSPHDDD